MPLLTCTFRNQNPICKCLGSVSSLPIRNKKMIFLGKSADGIRLELVFHRPSPSDYKISPHTYCKNRTKHQISVLCSSWLLNCVLSFFLWSPAMLILKSPSVYHASCASMYKWIPSTWHTDLFKQPRAFLLSHKDHSFCAPIMSFLLQDSSSSYSRNV